MRLMTLLQKEKERGSEREGRDSRNGGERVKVLMKRTVAPRKTKSGV